MINLAVADFAPPISFADVTLAKGVRLHYAHQGPQSGPAVVLLHGFSDSWFSFSRIMPLLPQQWRVIAPDLRGHGHSDRPANGYRIEDLAGDVVQVLDALHVPSMILIGHSMGSFVAQAIADRAQDRITSLVLVGSAATASNANMRDLRNAVETLSDPVDEEFVRAFQYSTVARPVPDAFMATAIENSRRMPARVWRQALQGLIEYQPATKRPPVRTLVIGGRKDSVFSAWEQTVLARQYPDARLQLIDEVGHTPHWEEPSMFVTALRRFVK